MDASRYAALFIAFVAGAFLGTLLNGPLPVRKPPTISIPEARSRLEQNLLILDSAEMTAEKVCFRRAVRQP